MGLGKKTIDDENYAGKRVLVRCDFNVPMKDGVITNDNRINAALPTIQKLINDGAKVILCSHLGKPKNGPEAKFSLAPVAVRLAEKLGQPVTFADDDNVVGPKAKAAAATMSNGDVVLSAEHPLPQGGDQERGRLQRRAGQPGRRLCGRRLRLLPPRPLLQPPA